jgi:hypothetical protein
MAFRGVAAVVDEVIAGEMMFGTSRGICGGGCLYWRV